MEEILQLRQADNQSTKAWQSPFGKHTRNFLPRCQLQPAWQSHNASTRTAAWPSANAPVMGGMIKQGAHTWDESSFESFPRRHCKKTASITSRTYQSPYIKIKWAAVYHLGAGVKKRHSFVFLVICYLPKVIRMLQFHKSPDKIQTVVSVAKFSFLWISAFIPYNFFLKSKFSHLYDCKGMVERTQVMPAGDLRN